MPRWNHHPLRSPPSVAPLLVALLLAVVLPAGPAAADIQPTTGAATFTDLTGGGACAFPGEPPDNLHVGISTAEFGTADVCGAYVDVTGPKGTVRVKVTDHCRNCPVGVLDITRKAFALIADVDAGRAPVTYQLVRNPALVAPMSLRIKAGSQAWFLQLQVLDHGNPLRSVELALPDGAWRPLVRTADNQWQASDPGPGDGPFTLRITDVHGQSATAYAVPLAPDQVIPTVARLYQPAAPSSPGPAPAPPSPPAAAAAATTDRPRPGGASHPSGHLLPLLLFGLGATAVAVRAGLRRRRTAQP